MRCSIAMASVLLAGFVIPAFAQVDQHMREQAETIVTQYVSALNKADKQAYAALFAANAIEINPFGKHKNTGGRFADVVDTPRQLGLTLSTKVEDVQPIFGGEGVLATAPYTASFTNNPATPQVRGNLLFVLERAGDGWKIRAVTASRLAPNAPAK